NDGPNMPKSNDVTPMSRSALMSPAKSAAPPVNSLRCPSTVPFGCASGLDDTRYASDTAFGSRPAFSVMPRNFAAPALKRSSVSIGNCGLVPIGYHASPYFAVRRMAGPLSPPIQIGIDFCTGFGGNSTSLNFTYLPSNFGASLVQSSLQTIMNSSVTAPRSANGSAPMAMNSSSHQPAPMPSVNRPFDR